MDQLVYRFRNRLLSSLPADELSLLERDLQPVDLPAADRVQRSGEPIEYIYFPHKGVVSLDVAMADGGAVNIALIGREGIVGGGSLRVTRAATDATVQVSGTASRIGAKQFHQVMDQSSALRDLVARHDAATAVYVQQSAACIARYPVDARMCRCLLEIQDRIDNDTLPLTQEALAGMLAVQRTTVTLAARQLQDAIQWRRGRIGIINRALMEDAVCECYGRIRRHVTQLLPESAV